MPSFTCFVDESGNDGPNLTNKEQPIFVHAGVLVPESRVQDVRRLAMQIHEECMPDAKELHAGLVNSARGKARASGLVKALWALGAPPVITIWERRNEHAWFFVDACFDYAWNSSADERWVCSANAKEELVETLVTIVPAQALTAFVDAWREREVSAVNKAIEAIARALTDAGRIDLSVIVLGALAEMPRQLTSVGGVDAISVGMNTINVSTFAVFLSMCERLARRLDLVGGRVVHDEAPYQFAAYAKMFAMMKERADGDIAFDNGQVNVALRRIETLCEANSLAEPGVQIADVLAGTYRRLVLPRQRNRLRDRAFDSWLQYALVMQNEASHVRVSPDLACRVWGDALARTGGV